MDSLPTRIRFRLSTIRILAKEALASMLRKSIVDMQDAFLATRSWIDLRNGTSPHITTILSGVA